MTRRHDVDPARLRAQLHRLTQIIEPAPDYLDRLRPRLRPARRRRTAGAIAAAGLAVAVGAGAILVGLLVGDRQPPGEPPPGVPRTMVVGAVEARPPLDRGLLRRDPMRFQQLMEQYEKRRRSALLRLDTATGKVRSVLYRTQGRHLAWALRDDGTAAVETGNSKCAFDLTAVAPDGRATPLGTVPGFEGNTGSSIASFALSPDGRLLAVTGTSCPDPRRGGALHWRVAVYRIGTSADPKPLVSFTASDLPGGALPNPADPSFSADGGHVVLPYEAGQGGFDWEHGVSGRIVTGFLDIDVAHPTRAPLRRPLRPSGARCLVFHNHLAFGRDPAKLISVEGCAGRQHLVEVDRGSGRVLPLLTVPTQPALLGADFDAARRHLLLQQSPPRQGPGGISLAAWDGVRSPRHLFDLGEVQLGRVTYWLSDPQW
jgi:hypothetical protein